jgi:prepilin peptidase CpaA
LPLARASGIRIVSDAIGYAGCALLLALACFDLYARRLPNPLIVGLCMLYVAHARIAATPLSAFEQHAAAALVVLLGGALLFAAGRVGGGDVKLASVLALWIGPHGAIAALAVISLAGLAVAIVGLVADRFARYAAPLPPLMWMIELVSAKRGVPYGVALAFCGVIALLPRGFVIG